VLHKMITVANCVPYTEAALQWPATGRHILASYDDKVVVVYQAFSQTIAQYAVDNQSFLGCPHYNMKRMTWIKTNFLWMMYRCGWSTKDENQSRVLALHVCREGFEEIIRRSVDVSLHSANSREQLIQSDVRCQWDPDHDPAGRKVDRRAIQLGLKGATAHDFISRWIQKIVDITDDLVAPQSEQALRSTDWSTLMVPLERVYTPTDSHLRRLVDQR
jgi:hypothetical protein